MHECLRKNADVYRVVHRCMYVADDGGITRQCVVDDRGMCKTGRYGLDAMGGKEYVQGETDGKRGISEVVVGYVTLGYARRKRDEEWDEAQDRTRRWGRVGGRDEKNGDKGRRWRGGKNTSKMDPTTHRASHQRISQGLGYNPQTVAIPADPAPLIPFSTSTSAPNAFRPWLLFPADGDEDERIRGRFRDETRPCGGGDAAAVDADFARKDAGAAAGVTVDGDVVDADLACVGCAEVKVGVEVGADIGAGGADVDADGALATRR
ncbi:hypothetical protein C8R45DRAFT_973119 [Mycena sanguinolenta]|nr:hypothetical protein C8R45DRAFT_973119 [Mycena sanguinolenta]